MSRGFEFASGLKEKHTPVLPQRSTKHSAGYDFFASQNCVIGSGETVLIPTGIKAYMEEDEVLYLFNRSSNALKLGLWLANGVGVVDSDYYNNPDNDGHIMFMFVNTTDDFIIIERGQKIGQGIFSKYLVADQDNVLNNNRSGGFGSTGGN